MLVLLRYTAPNDLYVEAVEFSSKKIKVAKDGKTFRLPEDSTDYNIGQDQQPRKGCPHGFIGLFDTENINHVNAMLQSAYNRTHD